MSFATNPISCFSTLSTLSGQLRAPASIKDQLLGCRLAGRYVLRQRLGQGAYGEVYRAERLGGGGDVAIKVLRPVSAAATSLLTEAWETSRIDHPNVVKALDFGRSEGGLLFLVLEYVDGVTLSKLVQRSGALPVSRAIELMLQISLGLEAVHEAGVVHADLKGSNILVADGEENGTNVKIVDFGIARRVESHRRAPSEFFHVPTVSAHRRSIANISGTPGYIAPEVLLGEAPTFRADVYAAGVVLYRLLTGLRPFPGTSVTAIRERQLAGRPIPPSRLRAHAPLALEAIAMRALDRNPATRYADAAELRRALEIVAVALIPGYRSHCC